jgi:hypothetical protein
MTINNTFYKECCDKFIDYVKKSHNERIADTSKTIIVEKEVYEAVLRNSVKVADLDAENQKLKELLKECSLLLIKQQANDEVEHKESAELVLRIDEVLK